MIIYKKEINEKEYDELIMNKIYNYLIYREKFNFRIVILKNGDIALKINDLVAGRVQTQYKFFQFKDEE